MVHAKYYETTSTFVEVMQKKLWPFFPDTVYRPSRHLPAVFWTSFGFHAWESNIVKC